MKRILIGGILAGICALLWAAAGVTKQESNDDLGGIIPDEVKQILDAAGVSETVQYQWWRSRSLHLAGAIPAQRWGLFSGSNRGILEAAEALAAGNHQ